MQRFALLATGALAGVALFSATAPTPDRAKVGKTVEYAFSETPDNGLGVTSMESLKGKPTLIEFWGTY